METASEGNLLEIIDLAHSLRQEHLYISNEQQTFLTLNETLNKNSSNVAQLAWICAQQRQNLNRLIVSRADTGPSMCCHKANQLENTKFIEAHKAKGIKYQHVLSYIELFNFLHRSPYLLAQTLAVGDRLAHLTTDHMNSVVHTIASGLYGNAILSKDVDMVLRLLRELIEIQIVVSDDPRRMLRSGACAFSRLYTRLHESLFSAKLFLTAALHESAMKVLIEDERSLDIDPAKSIASFSAAERLKRFGAESNADEYADRVATYRLDTLQRLFQLTQHCIRSLLDNWALFPSTLRWVVQTMCQLLKGVHLPANEINHILTDMVFTNFICPAIVSPDVFGITDAPVSENARYNLIQIGQIIQQLALTKHRAIDPKFRPLFDMFEGGNIVAELLEQLQETEYDVSVSMMAIPHQNDFGRDHVLVTQSELNLFVDFFRNVLAHDGLTISGEDRRKLGRILDQLPDQWETAMLNGRDAASTPGSPAAAAPSGGGNGGGGNGSSSRTTAKQQLIQLGKSTKTKLAKTISMSVNSQTLADSSSSPDSPDYSDPIDGTTHHNNNNNNNTIGLDEFEQVLIIPIAISDESKFQLLTEQEVLNMNNISGATNSETMKQIIDGRPDDDDDDDVGNDDDEDDDDDDDAELRQITNPAAYGEVAAVLRSTRKSTRFSLSNDDQSIGNTSDNLEVVSEVPSNHSVTSSVEMEDNYPNLINDNLSDMVSANVSGRGSPNISGRDTPSSQVTDGGDSAAAAPPPMPSIQMAKILNKARADINDKFCKFEINRLVEVDETVSIISDTWSTDVLASDSETLEPMSDCDRNFSTPLIPAAVVLPGDTNFDTINGTIMRLPANMLLLDAASSETRSESAWSTDVLASDSEKLIELDTDDNNSVTANSDTTDTSRNELDVLMRGPSESSSIGGGGGAGAAPMTPRRRSGIHFQTPPSSDSVFSSQRSFISTGTGGSFSNRFRHSSDEFARAYLSPSTPLSAIAPSSTAAAANIIAKHHQQQPMMMRRQNSAESSISNQSSNNEEAVSAAVAARNHSKHHHHHQRHHSATAATASATSKILRTNTNISNPFANSNSSSTAGTEETTVPSAGVDSIDGGMSMVQQREVSMAQRSTSFDGRRNGMMSPKVMSNNYENHEIIFKVRGGGSGGVGTGGVTEASITDDDKTRRKTESMLVEKTIALSLIDTQPADALLPEPLVPTDANGGSGGGDTLQPAGKNGSSRYTGTIPKSISFDETANKLRPNGYHHRQHMRHSEDMAVANNNATGHTSSSSSVARHPHGNSFFNKIKQGFRNRRSHKASSHHHRASADEFYATAESGGSVGGRATTEQAIRGGGAVCGSLLDDDLLTGTSDTVAFDLSEDILAKYRRKISSSSEATNSDSLGPNRKSSQHSEPDSCAGACINTLGELTHMLNNAKRKLRLVLSTTDLHTADFRHTSCHKIPPLMTYLQIQLAQALNLQHLQQISFISETIRCVRQLDDAQQRQLIVELQQDLVKRQSYLQYLMRYRQHLLSALQNIDRFEDRLRNDRDACNRHLIMVCVRMFLEKRSSVVHDFQTEFGALTVVDEKIDCMDDFMGQLMGDLVQCGVLPGMAQWQQQEARVWIERILLQKLYRQVMFPNDDADMSRDEVLRIHIEKLSRLITPGHPLLRIPNVYLFEAPWPFAQQQIAYISAYKTPREKVRCVVRCITSIMNLLQMASNRVPAADDLVPVLIFVVIKANPPYLLSTIQYVNAFIGNVLEGEDHYWWTQFSAAVTFIKTMDYNQ